MQPVKAIGQGTEDLTWVGGSGVVVRARTGETPHQEQDSRFAGSEPTVAISKNGLLASMPSTGSKRSCAMESKSN